VESGSPTLRRRRLGRALRSLRDKAGLTGDEVGARIERSGSWISRVEAGRVGLRVRDLRDLLDLYQLDDPHRRAELEALAKEGKQRGWWSQYSDDIAESYAILIGLEADARGLLAYENTVVPGLLQTADYCRAIIRQYARPAVSLEVLETRVHVRMVRQERLRQAGPQVLRFILDESVLHREIGGRRVLRDQLVYLAEAAALGRVDLRIIRFSAGDYVVPKASFMIIQFGNDPDVVYLENYLGGGGVFEDGIEEALEYRSIFSMLTAAALDPVASAALIREKANELA